jgi:Inositol phosphatase
MMSSDPVISVQKMRQQAIDVSQRHIVADQSEELVGGWALLAPREPNTIKSMPFEELVLLLTDAALYTCRFDWNMEKVSSFERVDLRHIVGIKYGTYITSILSPTQADEETNVGLIITYRAGANDIERVNTRSLSTAPPQKGPDPLHDSFVSASLSGLFAAGQPNKTSNRIVALKALPTRSAVAATEAQDEPQMSEIEQVKHVCSEIERLIGTERKSILEEGNIISLAEARRSTGLLEHLGHSLKKLVWA